MATLKCKSCGGDLSLLPDSTVCECEYCGLKQTVPTVDNEKKVKLFERANRLRMNGEFDKAAMVYESIIDEFDQEAEGYWGNLLCKFGIEYVDDPATGDKVPTCHRSSFDSIMDDPDFEMVMENADATSRGVYREQAKAIEEIRKGIIEVSGKEAPYDIFICYKETAEDGQRTLDSVLAQDVYDALTGKGYRVFFSRISLEDKLGTEYEPYIFAALNSAKIMLAFGTSYDNYNAVWVKNEWSRFLKLMAKDKTKHLIPCYKDIDAYDMPKEFARLQAQDLGKVGALQDLLRGIDKIMGCGDEAQKLPVQETVIVQQQVPVSGISSDTLVQRGYMALEDSEWEKADGFFEEALNMNPQCAEAYLGKLLARDKKPSFAAWVAMQRDKYSAATLERLDACPEDTAHIDKMAKEYALEGYLDEKTIRKEYKYDRGYDSVLPCRKSQKQRQQNELSSNKLLTRAQQYATGDTQKQIRSGLDEINEILEQRIQQAQKVATLSVGRVEKAYAEHIAKSDERTKQLNENAQNRREAQYQAAVTLMNNASTLQAYEKTRNTFLATKNYKNSDEMIAKCQREIERFKEKERLEEDQRAAIRQQEVALATRKRKVMYLITIVTVIVIVGILAWIKDAPRRELNQAIKNKTLTQEMCKQYDNDEYKALSDYLYSEKGARLIANTMMKYYSNDDVESAMWLLCHLDYSSTLDIYASKDFMNWIVDYMMKHATQMYTDYFNDAFGGAYKNVYCVGDYALRIDDDYDVYLLYPEFRLSNNDNAVWVANDNRDCAKLIIE